MAEKGPNVMKDAGKYDVINERISGVSTAHIDRSLHSSYLF